MKLSETITLYRDLFPTIEELKKKQRNLWDGHDPCSDEDKRTKLAAIHELLREKKISTSVKSKE